MKRIIRILTFLFIAVLLFGCNGKTQSNGNENGNGGGNGGNGGGNGTDTPTEVYYALTLPEGITSDQADNTKIKKDTEVTLTITIPENHELTELIIYGINLADDVRESMLKFTMTDNLEVTFVTKEIILDPVFYDYEIDMPSLWALPNAEEADIVVVEDAPDLLIFGIVLDSYKYYNYETMSAFEYVKVFNNTTEPYNLKGHRVVLCNPMQGQNYEDENSKKGNASLVTGHLFSGYIDEDFIIDPLSIALIWLKPYYYTAGSGSEGYSKQFSSNLLQKEASLQTEADFREFWHLDENIKVLSLANQPFIGKHPLALGVGFYPIISPGGGVPYTHLNTVLLRSLEIQKFDDQGGSAKARLLNRTKDIPTETLEDENLLREWADANKLYDKVAFNTMEVKDNGEVVDMYAEYKNSRKYFKPVVRANFSGLINTDTLTTGQLQGAEKVDFLSTSSLGIRHWPNTHELQFRPPKVGERIMQLQVPVRDYKRLQDYMKADQFEAMRFVQQQITTYVWRKVTIRLIENPEDYLPEEFKWRLWEVESEGRLSGAAPSKIKLINLTRP